MSERRWSGSAPLTQLAGHLYTTWPLLTAARAEQAPPAEEWALNIEDSQVGRVRLTGRLRRPPGARRLLLLAHGISGCSEARYMLAAARQAEALGFATLRFNSRGADRQGSDFYHAGLSSDLHAALASPELADFDELYAIGFSLGGHLALRMATEAGDRRMRAVAAVCAPLDLEPMAEAFDRPAVWAYRRYVLRGLCQIYAEVAARRPVPHPVERLRQVRHIREWDRLAIVPRFGFRDTADYYHQASVGPRLDGLRVPALLLLGEGDPMVPSKVVQRVLGRGLPSLEVRIVPRAGHLGFPNELDLGYGVALGLHGQLQQWLLRHAA